MTIDLTKLLPPRVAKPKFASPIKYPGAKSGLAAYIVSILPPHLHFVETHAGSLAVLLSHDPEGVSEVCNDLDMDVSNFWRVLQGGESFRQFERLCLATPFSETEWCEAKQHFDEWPTPDEAVSDRVMRAWRWFVLVRQSYCGGGKTFTPLSRGRVRRGMNEQASAWLTAVDRLPEVHDRLRRVVILCGDAVEVIRSQDGPATFFYADPCYPHSTRTVKTHYRHEMTDVQHGQLLRTLGAIRGRFILSGYRCPLYDVAAEQYGWGRIDIDCPNQMASGDEKTRRTECLWLNYSPPS